VCQLHLFQTELVQHSKAPSLTCVYVNLEENAFPIFDYYIYDLEQEGVEKLLLPQRGYCVMRELLDSTDCP